MAVINTAKDGALRNGLYAIFSIVIPRTVQTTTAINTASTGGNPSELAIKNVI